MGLPHEVTDEATQPEGRVGPKLRRWRTTWVECEFSTPGCFPQRIMFHASDAKTEWGPAKSKGL